MSDLLTQSFAYTTGAHFVVKVHMFRQCLMDVMCLFKVDPWVLLQLRLPLLYLKEGIPHISPRTCAL